jgi:hypothetical protein
MSRARTLGEIAAGRLVAGLAKRENGLDCRPDDACRRRETMKRKGSNRGAGRSSKVVPDPKRMPDKLPRRAPRRPAAARYDGNRPTGLKRRLGG